MQQALGRYDMVEYDGQSMHVAPDQCVVVAAEDGSCIYVYAQGNSPTGWRTRPDEPWNWMQPGESVTLQSGNKVSLDASSPETAVYKMEKAGRFIVDEYLNTQQRVVGGQQQGRQQQGGQQQGGQQQGTGQQQGGQGQLPPGWVTGVDQGQTYYYNE